MSVHTYHTQHTHAAIWKSARTAVVPQFGPSPFVSYLDVWERKLLAPHLGATHGRSHLLVSINPQFGIDQITRRRCRLAREIAQTMTVSSYQPQVRRKKKQKRLSSGLLRLVRRGPCVFSPSLPHLCESLGKKLPNGRRHGRYLQ